MQNFYGIADVREYPLGALESRLTPDVLLELEKYNLHEMSAKDIHLALFSIREKLKLDPWHPLTAVMQSYGFASFQRDLSSTGGKLTKDTVWCTDYGSRNRPLRNIFRTYEDTHDVYAVGSDGTVHLVGKFAVKVDGQDDPVLWSYHTERLRKISKKNHNPIEIPLIGEKCGYMDYLVEWKKLLQEDGSIVIHPKRSNRTRLKKQEADETPDLPNMNVTEVRNELSAGVRKKRLLCLTLMQSILRPALFSVYAVGSTDCANNVGDLLHQLDKPLSEYIRDLATDVSLPAKLPANLCIVCKSILQLGSKNTTGITDAIKFWWDEVLSTDVSNTPTSQTGDVIETFIRAYVVPTGKPSDKILSSLLYDTFAEVVPRDKQTTRQKDRILLNRAMRTVYNATKRNDVLFHGSYKTGYVGYRLQGA